MRKFENIFNEPVSFSGGLYALSRKYTAEEASIIFTKYTGQDVNISQLNKDRVRFGFPPADVEDRDEQGSCWYTGAGNGKGTNPSGYMHPNMQIMNNMKYSGCERYVVETTHGYYHDEQWGYATTTDNLEDAKKSVITFGTDYRVIDNKTGNIVYMHPENG